MNAVPPKISRTNTRFAVVTLLATGMGIAAMVFFFNPSIHHIYPVCQFHRLTGLNCPGCGGTRALYALLHGDVLTALRDNALLVTGAAGVILRGGWFGFQYWRGRPAGEFFPARWLWPLMVVAGVFVVLRNLPAFSFLSP